jgi:hypothetical protein
MDKSEFFQTLASIQNNVKIPIEKAVGVYAQIVVLMDDFKKLRSKIEEQYLLPSKETHYDIDTEKQLIYNSSATILSIDNEGIFSYLWLRDRRKDILENFKINLAGIDKLEDGETIRNKFVTDKGEKKAENISVKKLTKKKLKELKGE